MKSIVMCCMLLLIVICVSYMIFFLFIEKDYYLHKLKSSESQMRIDAVSKLIGRLSPEDFDSISFLVHDDSEDVRLMLPWLFAKCDVKRGMPLLSEMLFDKNRKVCKESADVLQYCSLIVKDNYIDLCVIRNLLKAFYDNINTVNSKAEYVFMLRISEVLSTISGIENFKLNENDNLHEKFQIYITWFYQDILKLPLPAK